MTYLEDEQKFDIVNSSSIFWCNSNNERWIILHSCSFLASVKKEKIMHKFLDADGDDIIISNELSVLKFQRWGLWGEQKKKKKEQQRRNVNGNTTQKVCDT